jgi:hypothetical protein
MTPAGALKNGRSNWLDSKASKIAERSSVEHDS